MSNIKLFVCMFLCTLSFIGYAQTPEKEEKTVILQTVELKTPKIHEGTTRNGNPKYWIVISDGERTINVSVSEGNAKKAQKGEITLELVKRQNKETGKITYSTRQLGGARRGSGTPDIDIKNIVLE